MTRPQILASLPTSIPAPVLLLVAAAAWGCSNVAQKTVLDHVGPLTALGLSSIVAAAALFPLARRELNDNSSKAKVLDAGFVLPVVVFVLALFSFQAGVGGTSASNAGFLVESSVVLTPFAAWFILGEKPGRGLVASIVAATLGLYFITGGLHSDSFAWGDGLCLLASLFFSLSIPLNSLLLRKNPRPALLSFVQFAVCGILCSSLGFAFEATTCSDLLSALPEVLFLGLISKALPYFLMAQAQQKVSAGFTNLIVSAEAPLGALAATLLIGESMTSSALLGAGLVMSAILASEMPALLKALADLVVGSHGSPRLAVGN